MSVSSWHANTSLARGRDRRWTARHRLRLEPAGAVADEYAGLRALGCAEPRHSHSGDPHAAAGSAVAGDLLRPPTPPAAHTGGGGRPGPGGQTPTRAGP